MNDLERFLYSQTAYLGPLIHRFIKTKKLYVMGRIERTALIFMSTVKSLEDISMYGGIFSPVF